MKFYYGADQIITRPTYGLGNPSNDYGLGFYLTLDKEAARLWASKNPFGGYLLTYDVDFGSFRSLTLTHATNEDVLRWITLLIEHRFSYRARDDNAETIKWLLKHYRTHLSEYDAVIGYRADDSYFQYSLDFVQNNLSIEALKEAMLLGKLGMQYVLISKRAFESISYLEYEAVQASEESNLFRAKTLEEYQNIKARDSIKNTFIRDLMRQSDD